MTKQVPSLGTGGTERRKPVRLLHGDAVSHMSRIDRKAKTETPPKMVKEVATATAEDERNSKRNSHCENGGVSLWREMTNASCGRTTPFGQPRKDLANNPGNSTVASDWGPRILRRGLN